MVYGRGLLEGSSLDQTWIYAHGCRDGIYHYLGDDPSHVDLMQKLWPTDG